MPITFQCPNPECKRRMTVKDELAGKRGACAACKKPLIVPTADGNPALPAKPAAAKPRAAAAVSSGEGAAGEKATIAPSGNGDVPHAPVADAEAEAAAF